MELFHKPEVWLILITAASEIIGMSKMKENSVLQLFSPSQIRRREVANEKVLLEGLRKRGTKKKGGKTVNNCVERAEQVALTLP